MNVAEAAAGGNRYELLLAMRERVAEAVSDPGCPPRELASLTRRLQDIAKEISELEERIRQEAGDINASTGASGTWDPANV